ncbi:uncharacterized protein LOC142980899 [Anticarsia gemmatalis]|uniref:uncharacterized protein LOC142980899 n=1 Tax=Anticarsia gemmatalis TaxID=129554 RepID=UPI003F775698
MAHHVEPMDIDSDFDNKENSLHHNNVLPFTEKGYEELDVSELNMKLRYSVTPASSPMSKSYTANCLDNRSLDSGDDSLNVTVNENVNLTRSLNSTMTKNDNVVKSLKALPLQSIPAEQYADTNRNSSVLRPLDAISSDNANITVTVSGPSDIDENLSLPSSSSSALQTPEATTPTKDPIPPKDGGSPIMRGLKSVLNMFRSSQSPIPPADNEHTVKQEILSPVEDATSTQAANSQVLASTPIAAHRKKEMSPTKRNSPQKDTSIVFNEDLEKELQWKDETTIIFSQERIPIHKLMFQQPPDSKNVNKSVSEALKQDIDDLNSTVEYMDISYNDSIKDRTVTEIQTDIKSGNTTFAGDSDSEFVDCETTFSKNDSHVIDNDKTPIGDVTQDVNVTKENTSKNESGSRLKQIILDTTQDILDATLSIRPEDLLPESETKDMSAFDKTGTKEKGSNEIFSSTVLTDQPIFDQTLNITNPDTSKIEESNVTITMENTSTAEQIFEQTVNLTKPTELNTDDANVTKVITSEPMLDQMLNVTTGLDTKTEDPNATKTLEVKSTTQAILDQTVNISRSLEGQKDANITQTIEATSISQPTFDQTVDITKPFDLEVQNENLNITKTIEAISTAQPIFDQTINLTKPSEPTTEDANITKTITSAPIFDQTVNISTTTLETKVNNPNATKSIETLSTTQHSDQTFDVTSNLDSKKDNLDATQTIQTILDQTQKLQNADGTITIERPIDKAVDNSINILNKVNSNIPESNLNKEFGTHETAFTENRDENPIAALLPDESLAAPIPEVLDAVKEASITELPVDIPLPDEDDLDKELDVPIDVTNEIITPTTLPLDLVDHIKLTEPALEETAVKITDNESIDKKLPEVAPKNTFECSDNVNTETIENIFTEVAKIIDGEQTVAEIEKSDTCKESRIDVLPEMPATVDVIDKENVNKMDQNCLKNVTDQISAKVESALQSQEVVPMDINESVCESKPLPDIINQAITSNAETVEAKEQSVLTEQVELKPEIVEHSNAITENLPEAINENVETAPIVANVEVKNKEGSTKNELPDPLVLEPALANVVEDIATEMADVDVTMREILEDSIKEQLDVLTENTATDVNIKPEIKENIGADEEIVASENNSPFVSVIAEDLPETKPEGITDIETVADPFENKTKVVITPPSSPPIKSKGYNFNFDDVDFDPFATKTKIRLSPEIESPNKTAEPMSQAKPVEKPMPKKDFNRRKSQPERKRPAAPKRKFNASFDATTSDKVADKPIEKLNTAPLDVQLDAPITIALSPNNVTIVEQETNSAIEKPEIKADVPEVIPQIEPPVVIDNMIEEPEKSSSDVKIATEDHNEMKAQTSSSEQSVYLSAGTSSSESIPPKNVFNLPEIDDINFNPFATKSKMRSSPPPDADNPFATKTKIMNSPDASMILPKEDTKTSFEDKIETEAMEKDSSANLSNTTVSSKATTVHTEDEDTVEGPFLEADDASPIDKLSDFDDGADMMQFSELPPQAAEDNADNGEMFIDAEAFEFLLNQNKCNTVVDSGKESLFLKFDPLFAKRMSAVTSDGVLASLAKLQKRQSTPTKTAPTPPKNMPSPVAGPSNLNVTQDMDVSAEFNDDLNITVSKPMMVVPPAVNPVTPRNKSLTPNRSNRRSVTFTSPAMAVIDRLLSLSGNTSLLHDTTVTQVSREQNEADIALSQLRELLAEKEISVYNLRTESNQLRDRLSSLENHVKNLEAESQDRLSKINQLNDTLAEKTKINRSMAAVVEEYERTIASLIAETAQDKKRHAEERIKLINERDEQTAHLASMEVSFSDLHSKYEKSKQVILNCKANEDAYKKSIKEFEENLTKMQNNYELLKQHATSKLNHANQELEKMNRTHEAEVLKLNAMIKRKELHITSLEESLVQKTKANEELTAICDELINKVG